MKIQKFNEKIDDDLYYEGSITFKFNISRKKIINYSNIFSDNEVKKIGFDGILEKYIFSSLDEKYILNNFNEINKKIEYELYDKDGNLIGKDIYDNSKKYNL